MLRQIKRGFANCTQQLWASLTSKAFLWPFAAQSLRQPQWQRLEASLVGSGRAGRSCQRLIDKESRLRNSCSDFGTVGVESDEVDSPRLLTNTLWTVRDLVEMVEA
jgi:hypothetical protein